jgi:hypothetical protein
MGCNRQTLLFIKKEIYINYGKFNTDYVVAADRELIFRLLQKEVSIGNVFAIVVVIKRWYYRATK